MRLTSAKKPNLNIQITRTWRSMASEWQKFRWIHSNLTVPVSYVDYFDKIDAETKLRWNRAAGKLSGTCTAQGPGRVHAYLISSEPILSGSSLFQAATRLLGLSCTWPTKLHIYVLHYALLHMFISRNVNVWEWTSSIRCWSFLWTRLWTSEWS